MQSPINQQSTRHATTMYTTDHIYIYLYIYIWAVVDIVVACLVDCWLLGDCIGKNRNTSSGQDFRIYSLKIHLQDKDIVTLHGIYSKNID